MFYISEESIPVMQRNVQDAVTKEMKEWLFKYVIIHNNLLSTHTNKMSIKKK